jgi:hypothetical protein
MIRPMASAALLLMLSAAAVSAQEGQKRATSKPVTVNIIDSQGKTVGTAALSEWTQGVKIKLDIKNLPPGAHLMHIHQFAKCEAPDFKSAGPHFNPTGASHGEHGPTGLPAGDIPNFVLTVGGWHCPYECDRAKRHTRHRQQFRLQQWGNFPRDSRGGCGGFRQRAAANRVRSHYEATIAKAD